jgi:outer membrane protein assembly factor BamA
MSSGRNSLLGAFVAAVLLILAAQPTLGSSAVQEKSLEKAPQKASGFNILPVLFYTPETKLAFGLGAIYYFRLTEDPEVKRPSNISALLIYTQRKQFSIKLNPDFYLRGNTHIQSELSLAKYPDKFFGVGSATPAEAEEDFTSKYVRLKVEALQPVYRKLNLGFQYIFDDTQIVEVEEGGELQTGDFAGREGGRASGLGYLMTWDSRDSIFFATSGSFHQFSATFFGRGLGSEFAFGRYFFDLRKYVRFSLAHSLALQSRMLFHTGTVPFWRLALLGGEEMMRGYYLGRYRDHNMISFQAEYRWLPAIWRIGVVGFAGIGDVADTIAHFDLGAFKYSYGFGLRFILNPEQKINLRLDFGFGKGTSGIYFTAGEAF